LWLLGWRLLLPCGLERALCLRAPSLLFALMLACRQRCADCSARSCSGGPNTVAARFPNEWLGWPFVSPLKGAVLFP